MYVKIVYPPHIWGIDAVRAVVEASDKAGERMEDAMQEVDDNLTVLTSRESGIARREELLGLIPKTTDTLEDRRLRVHLRWYNRESYTERSLKEKLNAAIGESNYTMAVDIEGKEVRVLIELNRKSMYQTIRQLLDDIVPLDYLIDVGLRYNTYQKVSKLTYGEMAKRTFLQLREEAI
jgi:hypothetical protein